MTDIVERLRIGRETCGVDMCRIREAKSGCTCAEAADEIERLRVAMSRLIGAYEEYVRQQYPAGSFKYPAVKRQHDVDMAPAVRARLALRGESNEQEIKA